MNVSLRDLASAHAWAATVETTSAEGSREDADAWQSAAKLLADWAARPDGEDEDGLVSPRHVASESAARLLKLLESEGFPPPQRVVPDGDGGISFERRIGERSVAFEIAADGGIEFLAFSAGRLVSRFPIEAP